MKIGIAEKRKTAAEMSAELRCKRKLLNRLAGINFLSSLVSSCVKNAIIKFIRPRSIAKTAVDSSGSIWPGIGCVLMRLNRYGSIETRKRRKKLAAKIESFSTGSADIILVYLTQIAASMRKLKPKSRREETRAVRLAGLALRRETAPMERASPNIRSESVCILGFGALPGFGGFSSDED